MTLSVSIEDISTETALQQARIMKQSVAPNLIVKKHTVFELLLAIKTYLLILALRHQQSRQQPYFLATNTSTSIKNSQNLPKTQHSKIITQSRTSVALLSFLNIFSHLTATVSASAITHTLRLRNKKFDTSDCNPMILNIRYVFFQAIVYSQQVSDAK